MDHTQRTCYFRKITRLATYRWELGKNDRVFQQPSDSRVVSRTTREQQRAFTEKKNTYRCKTNKQTWNHQIQVNRNHFYSVSSSIIYIWFKQKKWKQKWLWINMINNKSWSLSNSKTKFRPHPSNVTSSLPPSSYSHCLLMKHLRFSCTNAWVNFKKGLSCLIIIWITVTLCR